MANDLEYGQRVLRRIAGELENPEKLEHAFAEAVLQQAVAKAAGRPTPQAPMAAGNLRVQGSEILPSAGGPPEDVAYSAEFGSDIYLQFHRPSNPQGYWLFSSGESQQALDAGDRALEDILQKAVRSG